MRKPRKPNREETVIPAEQPAAPATETEQPKPAPKRQARKKTLVEKQPAEAAPAARERTTEAEQPQEAPRPEQAFRAEESPQPISPEEVEQEKSAQCPEMQKILRNHTLAAGGISCLPIPGADVLGMTAIQANMIEEISRIHGHIPTPGWSMRLAGLFVVSIGFLDVGKLALTSMAKLFPGAGTLIGIGGTAAYAAATTYALGKSVDSFYAQGGQPEHLVYSSLVSSTKSLMAEGREYWKQLLASRKKGGEQPSVN